ncbi:MAG TPA: GlsB/YeaQ/YmgE family stress response membrane protein [Candidatus Acidoferrum sp.]|nr:GlsB/YeaQ/YmgE family stress response membrane protein [Candidatus Acidoferrum sp.]
MLSVLPFLTFVDTVFGVAIDRGLLSWILLGLIAGWLAGKIARGRGYGCLTDILLGLIGSVLGGWIFRKLEIGGSGGWLYSLAAATVGAVVLVVIVHLFTGSKE